MQEQINKNNLGISLPKIYNIENMEEVYKIIDNMNETEQGIVIKKYIDESDLRSKVRNINYNKIRFLRGNTNNKEYLYFELRKNQKIVEYLEYFPEDKEFFDSCRFKLYMFTNNLFNYYRNLKVNKTVKFLKLIMNIDLYLMNYMNCLCKTKRLQQNKKLFNIYITLIGKNLVRIEL